MSAQTKEFEYVFLYKYDFRDGDGLKVKIPKKGSDSVAPILEIANRSLDLNRPAQQLFDENDEPVTQISQLKHQMKVYVSCTAKSQDESEKPLYKSRLPKGFVTSNRALPLVPQPEFVPKPEDAIHHQAIAASPYTVKENLRDSLLCMYSSLSQDHKAKLPISEALQKLSNETQQYLVEESMLSQFIGPSSVICDTPIGQITTSWAMDKLKGLRPEDCRFVINGPSQSGKTTLLSIFVSLFFQKLQLSLETHNYLVFPINWMLHQVYIQDVQKLYGLFVSTTLNAIRGIHMQYIPIISPLQQWFQNILNQHVFPNLPPQVSKFPGFPSAEVTKVGQNIHSSWNSKDNFSGFLYELVSLPNNLALAFGFRTAVYVFDHYDSCVLEMESPERYTKQSIIYLNRVINQVINQCPFFISSLRDSEFIKAFDIEQFIQISTERIVTEKGEKSLHITDPQFSLSMDMCIGCPGFCSLFLKIYEMAVEANTFAAVKNQFTRLRSVVDISRNELLKHELSRLCVLLHEANNEEITPTILNALNEKTEVTIKIH